MNGGSDNGGVIVNEVVVMDLLIIVVVCVLVGGDLFGVFKCVVLCDDVLVLVLCGIVMV